MSFLKKINNLFKDKNPQPQQKTQQNFGPKIIKFNDSNDLNNPKDKKQDKIYNQQQYDLKIQTIQDISAVKYQNLQKLPSLKDLGLKKDQIQEGQVPVLIQNKFVSSKMWNGKYQDVLIILTNYKMCIKPLQIGQFTFFVLGKIQKLNKYTNKQNAFKMLILLKDGRSFKFKINSQVTWRKIFDKIDLFSFIKAKTHFFAFKRFQANSQLQQKYKGWQLYNPIKQFKRMKIQLMQHTQNQILHFTSDFKILDNRDGKICTTYPKFLVVPSRMPYDYLVRCAKFRSRNRMPVLTYAYEYQKQKFSCLYRSSQSKVGVQNSRCFQDQVMVKCIGNHKHDPKNQNPYVGNTNCKIYDARNYMAALGNKFSGKGYESNEFYKNIELQFLNIPNIHAVRNSYNKALNASMGDDLKFHLSLAESQWYDFIFLILAGAVQIAKNLIKGINNLVHCSDGWDRTAQLCALASLILDPYYRTIQGFQILIQKDWIHFGHQFATRLGQGMNNPTSQQKSQVFLQFLDCVSQIICQFPFDFQFNYKFLNQIAQQAYSNLFGNFLCNCELQMQKLGITMRTISLWSYFAANKQTYLNPFYVKNENRRVLQVSTAQKNMRFFKQHFLQHIEQFNEVYDTQPSFQFTQENLQIMYGQLLKQKDNQNLQELDYQISRKIIDNDKQIQNLQKKIEVKLNIKNAKEIKNIQKKQQIKQSVVQTQNQKNNFHQLMTGRDDLGSDEQQKQFKNQQKLIYQQMQQRQIEYQ